MQINDIRVSYKLWATILGLLLVLPTLASLTLWRFAHVVDSANQQIAHAEQTITDAVLWRGIVDANIERTLAAILVADDATAQLFRSRQETGSVASAELQKRITANAESDADKQALAQISQERSKVLELLKKIPQARAEGSTQTLVYQELMPVFERYLQGFDAFTQVQEAQRDAALQHAAVARRNALWAGAAGFVLLFTIGVLMTWALVRTINEPLQRVIHAAERMGEGDLSVQTHDSRRDEFGALLRALSQMAGRLHNVIGEVHQGIHTVSLASNEIASGNQDLSMRTEQTAANLQQTSASMAQITATVTQSVQTAEQANLLAGQSAQAAQRGSAVMEQVVSSMARITESSRKINDIIGVIDGIAFQTNILALNAAVEAARAGEQGRGFAVVASEVRALAGRSADAAKEIKALIGSSVDTVQTGSAQVAEAGQTMSEIVEGARRVSALISDITTAANEQRDGITQVNVAVTQLDQMTQQNAALVEESAAAAASLREQAGRLEQVISVFDVGSSARHLGQKLLHQPSLSHQTSLA